MQLPYQSINYIPLQIEKNCCTSGSVKPYSGHRYPYKVFVEGVINMTDMQNCQSRQRLELKMPDKFSRRFGAFENSKRAYSWQFNLPKGFAVSNDFTHIHQIHVRDLKMKMPLFTHTLRSCKNSNKQCLKFELRYSPNGLNQSTIASFDIYPYLNKWINVQQSIVFSRTKGSIDLTLKHDNAVLFRVNKRLTTWSRDIPRPDRSKVKASPIHYRPKWGIYRLTSNESKNVANSLLLRNIALDTKKAIVIQKKAAKCN